MRSSLIVAVREPRCAETLLRWMPDLVASGFRRVTVFHSLVDDGTVEQQLAEMRPLIDRLNIALFTLGAETDLALKRGDAGAWLLALAELRQHFCIALRHRGATVLLDTLSERSALPVLALPDTRAVAPCQLFGGPILVAGARPEEVAAVLAGRAHGPLTALDADAAQLPRDGLVVVVPSPAAAGAEQMAGSAGLPVLFVPQRSLRETALSGA